MQGRVRAYLYAGLGRQQDGVPGTWLLRLRS